MQINNHLGSMLASQLQLQESASNLAQVANTISDPELSEVTSELIDSIVGQIPEIISYGANAQGIQTQQAVQDTLLNIKA